MLPGWLYIVALSGIGSVFRLFIVYRAICNVFRLVIV